MIRLNQDLRQEEQQIQESNIEFKEGVKYDFESSDFIAAN